MLVLCQVVGECQVYLLYGAVGDAVLVLCNVIG